MHEIEEQTKFYNSKAEKTGWRDFISPDFINPPSCQAAQLPNFRKRCAFAVAERHLHFGLLARGQGFTMAEILISLTIIGVIAAITLPSLRANINEKTWATQRKALYSRMSQAISMLPSLNGYGEYAGTWENDAVTVEKDTAAAKFVTDGLAKILNINNICTIPFNMSSENARKEFKKCGIPEKITNMANSKLDFPTKLSELNPMFTSTYTNSETSAQHRNPQKNIDTRTAAFETKNGESVAVFYNPYCQLDMHEKSWHHTQPKMCANFVYDLNGIKGPNKVGKDIGFITALYSIDPNIVAPTPLTSDSKNGRSDTIEQTVAAAVCKKQDENSRLPNRDELTAMFYNKQLIDNIISYDFWSSSSSIISGSYKAWRVDFNTGSRNLVEAIGVFKHVRCIKR